MLFDRFVVVDWSASGRPKRGTDSIWVADLATGPDPARLTNPSTRHEAFELLAAIVAEHPAERVLIGVDASLGYPVGTADVFCLDGVPWRSTWQAIAALSTDDERNRNNRFVVASTLNRLAGDDAGPFWGCPNSGADAHLTPTKPSVFPVGEYRTAERVLREAGSYPKSSWQLLGAGSVGSQTLTLLPRLEPLLGTLDVWPFTEGLGVPSGRVVVAEVWPSMFVSTVPIGVVTDAFQVEATAEALRDADRSGRLDDWFAPAVTERERDVIEQEEGWILGVPAG